MTLLPLRSLRLLLLLRWDCTLVPDSICRSLGRVLEVWELAEKNLGPMPGRDLEREASCEYVPVREIG